MRIKLYRIIVSSLLFIGGFIFEPILNWLSISFFISSYLVIGHDIILKAIKNLVNGNLFDENFLMSLATIGAIIIGEYPEATAVMLFYQVGELFQGYAVGKSRKSIAELMDIRPDYAHVLRGADYITVNPDEVVVGDYITVKAGEKVPLDGVVVEGTATIDTASLTGESTPREIVANDEIISGFINLNGLLKIKVTKSFEESTVNRILDLVENASTKKSKTENFITKFSKYYTPIVVLLAILLAVIPPLAFETETFNVWVYRALSFLVVSCPCALVISIPLSYFGGIGGASRKGILVKGGNYLDILTNVKTVVFDKTGTLTKGTFEVQRIFAHDIEEKELLRLVTHAEYGSNHPISLSLKKAYDQEIELGAIESFEEILGKGISATVEGRKIYVGNQKLMEDISVKPLEVDEIGTVLHVAIDNQYKGYILISDALKIDSKNAVLQLRQNGVENIVMLTGDNEKSATKIAQALTIEHFYYDLLPQHKIEKLEELLQQKLPGSALAFVGDGINDAPVLARADVGIAMGALGSDAAIESADILIMNDEPSKIVEAIKIAKKTRAIAIQNIVFALVIKVVVLGLSGFGISSMAEAIFADVGVTIIAVLNAFRVLKTNVKQS